MKVTIEMSNELANIDGVLCRVWNGYADNGIAVRFYVHRVAVPIMREQAEFKRVLVEMQPPTTETSKFDGDEPLTDG